MSFNPFTWNQTSERVHSDVLTLQLKDDKRNTINISQLSSDICVKIPLKDTSSPEENTHLFTKDHSSRFHAIDVDYKDTFMQLEIAPEDPNIQLEVFMKFGSRPTIQEHDLNGTVSRNKWCIWRMQGETEAERVCAANRMNPIQFFAQKPGKYYVEVRFVTSDKRRTRSGVTPPTPPQSKTATVVPEYDPSTDQKYSMRVALGSCVYWSDEWQTWTTEGCQVRHFQWNHELEHAGNKTYVTVYTLYRRWFSYQFSGGNRPFA